MSRHLHGVDHIVEVVLPITKMASKHVNRVQSRGQRPGWGTVWLQMTNGCYYSLPGETNRAPSCLVREEVEASKGLERYYRNGGDAVFRNQSG